MRQGKENMCNGSSRPSRVVLSFTIIAALIAATVLGLLIASIGKLEDADMGAFSIPAEFAILERLTSPARLFALTKSIFSLYRLP